MPDAADRQAEDVVADRERVDTYEREPDFSRIPPEGGSISMRPLRPDYAIDHTTGCWDWQRYIDPQGYGVVSVSTHVHFDRRAHREYYSRAFGPIPAGHHVHHRCENRRCVNPEHLEVVEHGEHIAAHRRFASTLCWDDVVAIRQVLAAEPDVPYAEIGRRFGLPYYTIGHIARGERWHEGEFVPIPRFCRQCGDLIVGGRKDRRLCGPECRAANERERRRAA